jgi:hypothetical protein
MAGMAPRSVPQTEVTDLSLPALAVKVVERTMPPPVPADQHLYLSDEMRNHDTSNAEAVLITYIGSGASGIRTDLEAEYQCTCGAAMRVALTVMDNKRYIFMGNEGKTDSLVLEAANQVHE